MSLFRTALVRLSFIAVAALAVPAAAHAQVDGGVRGGVSVNPDQVYFGAHIQTSPLVDRLRFRPNVEIGVGDNVTLTTFNFEFIYPFPSRQDWHLYVGAGPAVNFYRSSGVSDTNGGFNFLVGAENRHGLFFEAKVGAMDSPDVKFGVGYTFH